MLDGKIQKRAQIRIENGRMLLAFLTAVFVFFFLTASSSAAEKTIPITVSYSGAGLRQTITVSFSDEWLLRPDDEFNQKLMQASFVMAAAGFRSEVHPLAEKDHDILDFFQQAGFIEPQTDDYNRLTGINTVATGIAHKKIGNDTIIAVSISGNNYKNEWLSNLTVDDELQAAGFANAADRVTHRLGEYITDHQLSGNLRLWVTGYSRAAAITNIFASEAVDSGKFAGVYAYTFATPRTTKDENSGRYHNIFNIINPFDAVPMVPFPEWGFRRYGIDLFLPAIETDSQWVDKFLDADMLSWDEAGMIMVFNPQVSRELHTAFDYIAFFINSSASYRDTYQQALLDFWTEKDFKTLIGDIFEKISFSSIRSRLLQRDAELRYRFSEFYNFLDFLSQIIFTSFVGNKLNPEEQYWDSSLSLQENIAYGHYDRTYRYWLFSTDDADRILSRQSNYIHYSILGDVNVEIYDASGALVETFDSDGNIGIDTEGLHYDGFSGVLTDTIIYAERLGQQSLFVIPADQKFTILIQSNKDQNIRISYVEYSAEKLQGDVRYVYYDYYDMGESFPEEIDPEVERNLTKEELQEMGVMVVEPWSSDIVYSPTAVMRLENSGVFHPSPVFLLIFLLLIFALIIFLLIRILMLIFKGLRKLSKRSSARKNSPLSEDPLQ